MVLVELIPYESETFSGIAIPETVKHRDGIGRMPGQRGKVLSVGVWPTTKKGRLISYEFASGDIVIVDPTCGANLDAHNSRWKLYRFDQILAVVT